MGSSYANYLKKKKKFEKRKKMFCYKMYKYLLTLLH